MPLSYTYTVPADTPNSAGVDPGKLEYLIQQSSIVTQVDYVSLQDGDLAVVFKAELSQADKTTLDGGLTQDTEHPALTGSILAQSGLDTLGEDPATEVSFAPGSTVSLTSKSQTDGAIVVAIGNRIGKEVIYASHNYCDVRTWYSESVRVDSEALSDNAGVWESANSNWVSMQGGMVMDEDAISEDQTIFHPEDPHGYRVVVTVDAVEKEERLPLATTGGDYTVDYANGTVTPISEDWTGAAVLCSYSRAYTSGWVIRPLPGKALVINKSEVQFSKDIQMNTSIVMQAFGNVTYFAPSLAVSNGGPVPDGTPVPLETTYYKTLDQLVDESVAAFPLIPALSAGTGRGFSQDKIVFQFFYGASKGLFDSLGMFIRISLESDAPFSGERATATFYCNSKSDPGVASAIVEVTAE